jgi:ADP-ribose pyrophosphatase YjhB (NUDIX family)
LQSLIPPPLHRTALRVAHALRKRWWRLTKPLLLGRRVLALDGAGNLLLIRHSYGSDKWTLPGGGMARGEDAIETARREFAEETGARLADARLIAVHDEPLFGAINRVHVVAGRIEGVPRADGREVAVLGCFALGELPSPLASSLAARLDEWLDAALER